MHGVMHDEECHQYNHDEHYEHDEHKVLLENISVLLVLLASFSII